MSTRVLSPLLFMLSLSMGLTHCAGCDPPPASPTTDAGPEPPGPWDTVDGAPHLSPDAGNDTAARACAKLQQLGCPEWNPNGQGLAKCAQVYRDNADPGSGMHPECVLGASSKEDVRRSCNVRCGTH